MINMILDAALNLYLNGVVWQIISLDSGLHYLDIRGLKDYVDARTDNLLMETR